MHVPCVRMWLSFKVNLSFFWKMSAWSSAATPTTKKWETYGSRDRRIRGDFYIGKSSGLLVTILCSLTYSWLQKGKPAATLKLRKIYHIIGFRSPFASIKGKFCNVNEILQIASLFPAFAFSVKVLFEENKKRNSMHYQEMARRCHRLQRICCNHDHGDGNSTQCKRLGVVGKCQPHHSLSTFLHPTN